MKRNKIKIVSIVLAIILLKLFSCKNTPSDDCHCKIEEFKINADYKKYKETHDSSFKYLKYMNDRDENQDVLVFDNNSNLTEYVFYNTVIREPRFLISYRQNCVIDKNQGNPVYITSKYFNKYEFAKDTFEVFIHAAKPPNSQAKISIFKIISGTGKPVLEKDYEIKNNTTICFIGNTDGKQTRYLVYCIIYDQCNHITIRDSAYFSINSQARLPAQKP